MNLKFTKLMPIPMDHQLLDIVKWGRSLFGQEDESSYGIGYYCKRTLRDEPIWGFDAVCWSDGNYYFDFKFNDEEDFTLFVLTWG